MSRFDILKNYIPLIQKDNIGEWVFDKKNDGTLGHLIQVPSVNYSEVVNNVVDDVFIFHNSKENA